MTYFTWRSFLVHSPKGATKVVDLANSCLFLMKGHDMFFLLYILTKLEKDKAIRSSKGGRDLDIEVY